MNCFAPSITHSPSTSRARVFVLPASDPALREVANGALDQAVLVGEVEVHRGRDSHRARSPRMLRPPREPTMSDLASLLTRSATELAALVRGGEVTSRELAEAALGRID